jgi:hypothetical protein
MRAEAAIEVPQQKSRRGFKVVAGLFGFLTGIAIFGIPLIVVGWFDGADGGIHRFHGVTHGIWLGGLVAGAFLLQLRRPEEKVAQWQQILAAVAPIYVLSPMSGELDPVFMGGFAIALGLLAYLHPRRTELLRSPSISPVLLPISLLALVPGTIYALDQISLHANALPGDTHAEMTHYLGSGLTAMAIPLVALVASLKASGWRLSAWSAGGAAVLFGAACVVFPDQSSSPGSTWGVIAILAGVCFIAVAEWEARRP